MDSPTIQEQQTLQQLWQTAFSPWTSNILPSAESLARARSSLSQSLAEKGAGLKSTKAHILDDIVPAFNGASISANYYGFVTGGVTAAALFADHVVSTYDQNVQVHLPDHSIVTEVEYHALGLVADLLHLDRRTWLNGTFTTGATASNILGLACGREFVVRVAAEKKNKGSCSVGEDGLFQVLRAAGLSGMQVLSTLPHSSLGKAAGVLGIGRANVKNVGVEGNNNHNNHNDSLRFDFQRLERELAASDRASIVAVSCGEVNTGHFATGIHDMQRLRRLCDEYGAWLHVDGAFGIFGRILDDSPEFASIKKGCQGLELADSIAGDGHKLLNVPYDCGFFFCRHPNVAENVFRNPNAAYLSPGTLSDGPSSIPSPLNHGLENSRRFRALPVYASLVSYGKEGYRDMLQRQIRLARMIAAWLFDHAEYIPLPEAKTSAELLERTYMIVLLRARDEDLNEELAKMINSTSKMFVSGTTWCGKPACRIAISNWRVNEERDFALVKEVLESVTVGKGGSRS